MITKKNNIILKKQNFFVANYNILLKKLTNGLTESDYQAMVFYHYEKLTIHEIALFFGCSEKKIMRTLYNSRIILRKNLKEMGGIYSNASAAALFIYLLNKERTSVKFNISAERSIKRSQKVLKKPKNN